MALDKENFLLNVHDQKISFDVSHKIIVKNPPALRDALQQDDRLFDAVQQLVEEYADGRDPRWFRIACQPSVAINAVPSRLVGEENT